MYPDLLFLGPLMTLYLFIADYGVRSGELVYVDSAKACSSMPCNERGEYCLSRKFWCKNRPCPSMLYCSKTPRESLEGPTTCESTRCSKGYICLVRVRQCRWDQGCRQQIARCVSDREYRDGPASCADFHCPSGHRCVLRESLCDYPPCKLLKSCAKSEDVKMWHDRCRTLGCPSEYECFLRKPSENCSSDNLCKHTPDCTITEGERQLSRYVSMIGTESFVHPSHLPTPSRMNCSLNKCAVSVNWGTQLTKWSPKIGSIYRTPVYVRSTVSKNGPEAGKYPSEETPTDHSITEWLDHLRLKTGVDAINVWVKQAEENRKYEQFNEWLEAVKATLGPLRFEIWLREIRRLTSKYPAFQKWLVTKESASSLTEHQTDHGNDKQLESLAVIPDQRGTLLVDSVQKTTESPMHDSEKSTDFFHLDQRTPNITPLRKNAGHPRINYGENRGYKEHRDFGSPDLKNEMPTWYMTQDHPSGLQTDHPKTDKSYTKIESVDPSHKTDKIVPSLDSLVDSVAKLQKNIRNDSTLEDGVQLHNLQDPMSNMVARRQEKLGVDDLMNENVNAEVPLGSSNFGQKASDQIGNRSGVYPNVLFNRVEYHKWHSEPERNPVSTNPRQFTEEDQRESSQASESPESMQRQYYQRVHELDHKVPESVAKSGNSSSEIGMKKEKDLTGTYTLFTPVTDELHIISPLDAMRVVDPGKRTHYTLVGFPQETANDRIRTVGYPWAMSEVASIDKADIFTQDSESSPGPERITTPNPWNQILQHQPLPRRLVPVITKNYHYPNLGERRDRMDSENRQSWPLSKQQEQTTQQSSVDVHEPRPVPAPFQNWYPWDGRRPHHLSEDSHVSDLPKNSHNIGSTDSEESLKGYYGVLSSQEYVDAYVDAVIEDALSEVILGGELQDEEDPRPLLEDLRVMINKRLEEDRFVDTVLGAQFPGKDASKPDGDPTAFSSLETVQSLKDVSTSGHELTTASTPNLSTDSIMETDYRYECEDETRSPSKTLKSKEKSSVIEETYSPGSGSDEEEVEEYYSEDKEQQEYFEEASRYRDEYFWDLETNLTDYDFQYYDDEEDKETDLSQLHR